MSMFTSILVVCAGNICRSPTAEYILKNRLTEKSIAVSSAGLTALVDKGAESQSPQRLESQLITMSIYLHTKHVSLRLNSLHKMI